VPAKTNTAVYSIDSLTLTIISEHGTPVPGRGVWTNLYGAVLTNSVGTPVTLGSKTQYVGVGWTMTGDSPASGVTNRFVMTQTHNAILTWLWDTNYLLELSADHGVISNAVAGWKPAGWVYDLYALADVGYVFDHWQVNGVDVPGTAATPLNVTMDMARSVKAVFTPALTDYFDFSTPVWTFVPLRGTWFGTLVISNKADSAKSLTTPVWYEISSNEYHWLRFPTGVDPTTGFSYLDISTQFAGRVVATGNSNLYLDPGEFVTITNLELMARRNPNIDATVTSLVKAVWVELPGGSPFDALTRDTDGDGIPNYWEARYPGILNEHDPDDAALDSDSDGMPNGDEFTADTSPTNRLSLFLIVPKVATHDVVQWQGSTNRLYSVWYSTNLLTMPFQLLSTNIAGQTPLTYYTNVVFDPTHKAFYRGAVRLK
jgi:hypothetical protein